jgi:hypothetical protein
MEMLFYELPHYMAPRVQVDVYTTFRAPDGGSERACILSTTATREEARQVDWEDWTAADVIEELGGRCRMDDRGHPLPIEVEPPAALEAETGETTSPSPKR